MVDGLPDCDYRLSVDSKRKYFCRNQSVHAPHQLVPASYCRRCEHRSNNSPLRPVPSAPFLLGDQNRHTLQFIPTTQLVNDVYRLAENLPTDLTAIAGIPRSGMLPASLLATHLHLPLLQVDFEKGLLPVGHGKRLEAANHAWYRSVLVVDDSIYGGVAIERARDAISNQERSDRVHYAAIYPRPDKIHLVDFFARAAPTPHLFQWNLFNCNQTSLFAFDFDGVLCEDFDGDESDEGSYLEFLELAKPKWLPRRRPIPLVVTARLEKYRTQTIDWLNRHRVEVEQLEMGPWEDTEERRASFDAGEFKGGFFKGSDCTLFIESCPKQAKLIHEYSGKPVLCPGTQRVFQ